MRPPWVTTSQACAAPRRLRGPRQTPGVDGADHGLAAEAFGAGGEQLRLGHGGGVEGDLVRAGSQHVAHLVDAAHAAADGERHEGPARRPPHHVQHRAAALGGGGDIQEDDLVGALVGVALGQLGRIAFVGQVHEVGAFDDAAVVHVQAGMTRRASITPPPTRRPARRPRPPRRPAVAAPPRCRHQPQEVGQQPQAGLGGLLGVELQPVERARGDRAHERTAVRRAGHDEALVRRSGGERVDEVEVRAVRDSVEERMRPDQLDRVPADVRQRRGILQGDRSARRAGPASRRRLRRCGRRGSESPGRSPGMAGPREPSRAAARPGLARAGGPSPARPRRRPERRSRRRRQRRRVGGNDDAAPTAARAPG